MEIGGCDIIVDGTPPSKEQILETIKSFWPDLVVEDDDMDFFVYENQSSKQAWDLDYSDEIDAQMIYVLPRENGLTLVIDGEKKLLPITEAVRNLMTRISLEDIMQAARDIGIWNVSIEQGEVLFVDYFEVYEDQETHDVAWDRYCYLQERLNEVGLQIAEMNSDNDSVFGKIEKRKDL